MLHPSLQILAFSSESRSSLPLTSRRSGILQTKLFAAVVAIPLPFVRSRSSRPGKLRIYVAGARRRSSFAPVCALSAMHSSLQGFFLFLFFRSSAPNRRGFFAAASVSESMNPFLLPGANPLSRLRPAWSFRRVFAWPEFPATTNHLCSLALPSPVHNDRILT